MGPSAYLTSEVLALMNLKMDGAAQPLGFRVLLVKMFKAVLSYLHSFSKVLPYPLGSCEKKMLIYHRLLTTSPTLTQPSTYW